MRQSGSAVRSIVPDTTRQTPRTRPRSAQCCGARDLIKSPDTRSPARGQQTPSSSGDATFRRRRIDVPNRRDVGEDRVRTATERVIRKRAGKWSGTTRPRRNRRVKGETDRRRCVVAVRQCQPSCLPTAVRNRPRSPWPISGVRRTSGSSRRVAHVRKNIGMRRLFAMVLAHRTARAAHRHALNVLVGQVGSGAGHVRFGNAPAREDRRAPAADAVAVDSQVNDGNHDLLAAIIEESSRLRRDREEQLALVRSDRLEQSPRKAEGRPIGPRHAGALQQPSGHEVPSPTADASVHVVFVTRSVKSLGLRTPRACA